MYKSTLHKIQEKSNQNKSTLENTEGAIKNGQSRETGNIPVGYTRRRQAKHRHNTICVGHHYAQIKTNNVSKTWTLLQTTGGKDEPNIVFTRQY